MVNASNENPPARRTPIARGRHPRAIALFTLPLLGAELFAGLPAIARADEPAAIKTRAPSRAANEARAREAKAACAAGEVERGIKLLAELYAESNKITYVYNQGRCYQQNGRPREAVERFREYLRRDAGISDKDRGEAEGFIRELEADIAKEDRAREDRRPDPEPLLPTAAPVTAPSRPSGAAIAPPLPPGPG